MKSFDDTIFHSQISTVNFLIGFILTIYSIIGKKQLFVQFKTVVNFGFV